MRRREFITLIGGAAATLPRAARAQQTEQKKRIGVLMSFAENDASARAMFEGYRNALVQLGWIEGKNLQMEVRWAAGNPDKIKAFTGELVGFRPDAILVQGTVSTGSVVRATQNIPVVFVNVADPVGSGYVPNLTHPGGNVTGFMLDITAQGGKWVELLKEIAPRIRHIALLSNAETGPPLSFFMPSILAAASSFSIEVNSTPIHAKEEIEGIIADQSRDGAGGLVVTPAAFHTVNRDLIIALAAQYRLPTIYHEKSYVGSGGLIAYTPDYASTFVPRQAMLIAFSKGRSRVTCRCRRRRGMNCSSTSRPPRRSVSTFPKPCWRALPR